MSLFEHIDRPHAPGTLYDCMACEYGDCICDASLGHTLCVSEYCIGADTYNSKFRWRDEREEC